MLHVQFASTAPDPLCRMSALQPPQPQLLSVRTLVRDADGILDISHRALSVEDLLDLALAIIDKVQHTWPGIHAAA